MDSLNLTINKSQKSYFKVNLNITNRWHSKSHSEFNDLISKAIAKSLVLKVFVVDMMQTSENTENIQQYNQHYKVVLSSKLATRMFTSFLVRPLAIMQHSIGAITDHEETTVMVVTRDDLIRFRQSDRFALSEPGKPFYGSL